ncbi:MAG: hypothetical protein ACRCWD_02010 [Culicoidibacterales bacterium]
MKPMIPEQRKSLFRPLVISYIIVSILLLIFDYFQNGSITNASLALLSFLITGLAVILLSKWKVKNQAIQEGLFLFLAIMLVFLLVVAYLILQL